MAQIPLRPQRSRGVKHRHTYREPDSESEIEYKSSNVKSRPTRSSRRIQTYRENTTDDGSEATTSSHGSDSAFIAKRAARHDEAERINRRRSLRSQKRPIRAKHDTAVPAFTLNSFKRQKHSHPRPRDNKAHADITRSHTTLLTNVKAPPWQTLEYQILVKIMQYAAYPLYISAFRSRSSIEWLTGISRLCKSFHGAAVATLLWEPPLMPSFRANGLLALMSQSQGQLSLNYCTKIRSLSLEVKHLLVKKSGIKISSLLKFTPLLIHLRVFHGHDELIGRYIWAVPRVGHYKWSYEGLFDHLDQNGIRLKSFEWNGRFLDTIGAMQSAHKRACMKDVQTISIVNLNYTDKQEEERSLARDLVISALALLPDLKTLEFRNCTVIDIAAMTQLPIGLTSLTIVNCLSLTSEGVDLYLKLGGLSLRNLYFEGNQVMDLAFMPQLAELCPELETIFIDLSYEDCSSYSDRDPLYDELLPNGSPSWPSKLSSIVIGPLRSLNVTDAEDFYNSLIASASNLPYLRTLSIKTFLADASWRDRALLRSKWRSLFDQVFAADKTYKPMVERKVQSRVSEKSGRRKSARLKEQEEISVSEDDQENNDSDIVATSLGTNTISLPRQNRCDVVEFELSDQRPAPQQYREADFLDTEPSGDEEWNGRDEAVAGANYAW